MIGVEMAYWCCVFLCVGGWRWRLELEIKTMLTLSDPILRTPICPQTHTPVPIVTPAPHFSPIIDKKAVQANHKSST